MGAGWGQRAMGPKSGNLKGGGSADFVTAGSAAVEVADCVTSWIVWSSVFTSLGLLAFDVLRVLAGAFWAHSLSTALLMAFVITVVMLLLSSLWLSFSISMSAQRAFFGFGESSVPDS